MLPLSTNVRLQILPCPPRADTHGWHSTSGRMPDKGEVTVMEVVHQRCAGLDISKSDAKLCVRTPGSRHRTFDKKVTVWGSFSNEVARLREHLIAEGVSLVVMEATGDYWKPFLYRLQDCPFEVMLVNARHAKNLPGRKADVSDAQWLAELGAHGLVRASFVPPQPIRELRQLTRSRTIFTAERARESQRLEKLLEDSGIKLSSVATQITGVSGRAILAALISGERDPAVLADLAKGRLRVKIPALVQALTGTFTEQHAFMAATHLDHIDRLTVTITAITARIAMVLGPFHAAVDLLVTIPGVSQIIAEIVIAESGSRSALRRSGPLRTVRAPHRRTRLKQAARALRVAVLASCVCGLGARGGRRCVSSGCGSCPAHRARRGGRGGRRRSPCGPRSATSVPIPEGTGAAGRG